MERRYDPDAGRARWHRCQVPGREWVRSYARFSERPHVEKMVDRELARLGLGGRTVDEPAHGGRRVGEDPPEVGPPPISPLIPFSSAVFAAHSRESHVPCWVMRRSTEPASVVTQYW